MVFLLWAVKGNLIDKKGLNPAKCLIKGFWPRVTNDSPGCRQLFPFEFNSRIPFRSPKEHFHEPKRSQNQRSTPEIYD